MRTDILDYLANEIYLRCQKPTNRFGMGCYYHIVAVVKNGELLAQRYSADKEIAYTLLSKFSYDEERIARVQACIRNHRGSVCLEKNSIEELCVADADAISHFDSVPSLLYLAYVERQMSIEEGIKFVRSKLERSYNKLSADSKEYYKDKYKRVLEVLEC